jgi:hypothetical protein
MDNSVDLPGYKHYVDPDSGERPAVFVTFLDLVEAGADESVNGVVFPVSAEELELLDARERNYERREVTDRVDGATAGARVWAYVGSAAGRARFDAARSRGLAVVDRAYLELVRTAFAALGDRALRRFDESTDPPGVPLRALRRVDLPAAG